MWELLGILLILFIGSFIQASSSIGFGLFAMGFLPMLISLQDSTLLIVSLAVVISLKIFIKYFKHVHVKSLLFVLVPALAGRVLSFFILSYFGNMDDMKKWLGFVLVGMVIYLLASKQNPVAGSDLNMRNAGIFVGFIGGFIGGVFAIGGPFFVFYFLLYHRDKFVYNANLQASFLCTDLFTVLLHVLNGDFHGELSTYFLLGSIIVFLGTILGLRWYEHIPHAMTRKIASFIIFIAGLNLIIFSQM